MPWYTWVFSGIGVLIVSLAANFFRRQFLGNWHGAPTNLPKASEIAVATLPGPETKKLWSSHDGPPSLPRVFPSSEYHRSPTPEEIWNQIESLPPFQQLGVKETYKGIKVRWPAHFLRLNLASRADDEYYVSMRTGASCPVEIDCKVKLGDYPRLRVARRGDPVTVAGTVMAVRASSIVLEVASLDFPESAAAG